MKKRYSVALVVLFLLGALTVSGCTKKGELPGTSMRSGQSIRQASSSEDLTYIWLYWTPSRSMLRKGK